MLIKESDGSSKGCAFLTYENKESSILAIRRLNASAYILDHDKPLEVRFAENRKKTTTQPQYRGPEMGGAPYMHGHYNPTGHPMYGGMPGKPWGEPTVHQVNHFNFS